MITYQATEKLKELESEKFSCKITSHKFDKDSGTGTIIFKEELEAIHGDAFLNCKELLAITLPDR